jgi:hypothetical protein
LYQHNNDDSIQLDIKGFTYGSVHGNTDTYDDSSGRRNSGGRRGDSHDCRTNSGSGSGGSG